MDLRHSILIYLLPEAFMADAVKSISELTAISEKSISLMKPDHWGAKIILDNEQNFRNVISLCALPVHGKTYNLYSLVTDLIIYGTGVQMDALKVEFLLERYAPVLFVYELKNKHTAITFRAALNYPEIPEIIQLWTGTNLKISGYEGNAFSIFSFCRFCRQNGHFKSQCGQRQIPAAREVTSAFPSFPNCKVEDQQTAEIASSDRGTVFSSFAKGSSDSINQFENSIMESTDRNTEFPNFAKGNSDSNTESANFAKGSSDKNTGFSSFAKGSSDSNTESANFAKGSSDNNTEFANFAKGSSDSNTEFANFAMGSTDSTLDHKNDSDTNKKVIFEATSSQPSSHSSNLHHLIPPSMQNDIETLKLFFSHCKSFKHLYKVALRYPAGIGTLLRQLRKIVKFNKDIKTKSEEEMKCIAWICLLLSKLQYLHLKKNVQIQPFYEPPL